MAILAHFYYIVYVQLHYQYFHNVFQIVQDGYFLMGSSTKFNLKRLLYWHLLCVFESSLKVIIPNLLRFLFFLFEKFLKIIFQQNIEHNMKLCFDVGLENFIFEVVTDKLIGLENRTRLRELVVPSSYRFVFLIGLKKANFKQFYFNFKYFCEKKDSIQSLFKYFENILNIPVSRTY